MACRIFPDGLPVTTAWSFDPTCNDLYGFNCHTSFGWYCMIYVDHTVCYRPL
jgi:hypothetical protein